MNQTESRDLSERFSEAWSGWNGPGDSPDEARENMNAVKNAAFNQCFDFLPEGAIAAVVDRHEDSPCLVALDGDRLYGVFVVSPGTGPRGPATTECDLYAVDPRDSHVACRTKFIGVRASASPLRRETRWIFRIGDLDLSFETRISPERSRLEADETFAQALASALGWKQFPPVLA